MSFIKYLTLQSNWFLAERKSVDQALVPPPKIGTCRSFPSFPSGPVPSVLQNVDSILFFSMIDKGRLNTNQKKTMTLSQACEKHELERSSYSLEFNTYFYMIFIDALKYFIQLRKLSLLMISLENPIHLNSIKTFYMRILMQIISYRSTYSKEFNAST